jgi:hypothetical protein
MLALSKLTSSCASSYATNEALSNACFNGQTTIVEQLIASGVNVNHIDMHGRTAIVSAVYCGHTAIVEQLIAAGADISLINKYGETLLHIACQQGHVSIVEQLIAAGADISLTDERGEKAIHYATKSVAMMKVLIRAGADWEAATKEGMQPIHFVCNEPTERSLVDHTWRIDCLKFLINECGVDVDAVDNNNHDAWWYIENWMYPDSDTHPEDYANTSAIQHEMFAIINASSAIDSDTRESQLGS